MKDLMRLALFGTVAAIAAVGLSACAQKPDEPPYTPPEVEYTVSASDFADGADPNGAQFSAASYERVEGHPLEGKLIYWLGSSVTYGSASMQESMADFLAAKTGCICKKEAVSGTTIFDDGGNGDSGARSYTRRLVNSTVFSKDEQPDFFICQISTNDAVANRLQYRGAISDAGWDHNYLNDFDRKTTLGGVEFIIAYVWETWHIPVYFYSGAWFGDTGTGVRANGNPSGTNYAALVDEVLAVCEKWQALSYPVDVIDLFHDESFNAAVTDEYYTWCRSDAVHPKRAGYRNWWMPYFEQFLLVKLHEME